MPELPDKVPTAELRPGDHLLDTMGLVVAGPPGTEANADGYVPVPLEGSAEPVPFLLDHEWRVDRTSGDDTEAHTER